MENKYKCICGKTFDSIFALSGHKSHCKEYQLTTHGNLDKLNSFSIKESEYEEYVVGLDSET